MRVISGRYGGRRLLAVPGTQTRPTTDKVKEALFSMIGPYFDGGIALDLFAGTGGLGIEAVSRGCDQAILVDKQRQAQETIQHNIVVTKEPERFQLLKMPAQSALAYLGQQQIKVDLVFLDPPYRFKIIPTLMSKLAAAGSLAPQALIIAETDHSEALPEPPVGFTQLKHHDYGLTQITVYRYLKE
ncbi:16S rRNA (guanine(966)-N(2))-methyltransferase RsmD [Lapidilactobacillus luobeiensis]|uniref:16S rRNA (guanine(966)-N(2))-methyltransferase RsmD n=1 Tax=Lapidilactobacillus luobeiensis TaxID=2950371 RepID=UPI0021C4517E|nr:16S rRNA (guanine(966)-N(2))-methyltransferase RsmD [Lapidilactobacillus luobeiensis]